MLSEGKPTSSSSLFENSDGMTWPASNAVQNNSNLQNDCIWHNPGSVAIMGGTDLYWQVDLEDIFLITQIQIYGFNLIGYSDNVQFSVCNDADGTDCIACGVLISTTPGAWVQLDCSVRGRFVRLTNSNSGDIGGQQKNWHFCRVAVYGADVGIFEYFC